MNQNAHNQDVIEKLCESPRMLLSPFINKDDEIFFASYDGYIYRYKEGNFIPILEVGGQPQAILIDSLNNAIICDISDQSIKIKNLHSDQDPIRYVAQDFEGESLLGPNSMALSKDNCFLKRSTLFY